MHNGIASQSRTGARVWLAALVLTSLSAAPALAQARKASGESQAPVAFSLAGAKALFKRVDKDADGLLSPSESPASGLGPRDVTAADADKNGRLSENEFLVGLHGWLSASGRTIDADFEAEVVKLRAAAKPAAPAGPAKPAAPGPGAQPAGPRAAAAPGPNPSDEINRKIDEALRKAQEQDGGAKGGVGRARNADAEPAAAGDLAGLSKEAQDALNRRLRTSGVTPETAAAERQALQQRIDNAGAGATGAAPAESATPPAPCPVGAPAAAPASRAAAPVAGASAAQPASRPAAAPSASAPAAAPADPDMAAKLQRALDATERRMKKDGASAEEIETAKEQLRQRAQQGSGATEPAAVPNAAPNAAPGASPARAPAAAPAAVPASAPKPAAAPAGEDEGPEQDPAALRSRLETLLKARNASPEEAQAERAKLEKRIARQASGGKGAKAKAGEAKAAGVAPSGAGAQPKPAASGGAQPQQPAANPARGGAANGRPAKAGEASGAPAARPANAPASGRGANGAKPQPAQPQKP